MGPLTKVPAPTLVIKDEGIFDFEGLYKTLVSWFIDQGYRFEELSLKHKVPSLAGTELEYIWFAWRRHNEYTKFCVDMIFKLYDAKDLDVIKDGKKKRLTKARILCEFYGYLELDYSKRFSGNKFLQGLNKFLQYQILMKPMEGVIGSMWWDELYYRTLKLHAVIKEYLALEAKGNAYFDMW